MSYINSELELKEHILGKLGSAKHKIEISDDNWTSIFQSNLKYLKDYSSDVVYEDFFLVTGVAGKEVELSDNVASVKFVREKGSGSIAGSGSFIYSTNQFSDFIRSTLSDTSNVYRYRESIKEIRSLMNRKVKFDYNNESNKLRFGKEINNDIYICAMVAEDIDALYENYLFHLLLERDCWSMWHSNTSKFTGNTIGNGATLNTEHFEKKYEELTASIKEKQENEEFDFLRPIKISNSQ